MPTFKHIVVILSILIPFLQFSQNEQIVLNDSLHDILKETQTLIKKNNLNEASIKIDEAMEVSNISKEKLQQKAISSNFTTFLSIAFITILSLLALSFYKNNSIRRKTYQVLIDKNVALRLERDKAKEASQAKTNFLSTVTHELRTPLYALTGLTDILIEESPKKEQLDHLKSLKFSSDYLLSLVNSILEINKIEAGKVELNYTAFNLKEKTQQFIEALYNTSKDNNTITLEYDSNLEEIVVMDELKVSQIIMNLLGNAIKFTKNDSIWVRIKKAGNTTLTLEVEDTGIGISEEKQQQIFESFEQGSKTIGRNYGGSGLGLFIVKILVSVMEGKMQLKSTVNKGSTFTVNLPYKAAVKSQLKLMDEKSLTFDYSKLKNLKILIVEDNKINQLITKKTLERIHINHDIVDDGETAINHCKTKQYDLILMDIHMPGISGIEAAKQIRSFNKTIPIFALTAVTLKDKKQEFDNAGFNAVISKPFKAKEFRDKLYNTLILKKP